MTVKSKIIISLVLMGLVSIAIIGILGYSKGKNALQDSYAEKLTAARSARAMQVEEYFATIRKQMKTFSENRMIVDAMGGFKPAFHDIVKEKAITKPQISEYSKSVMGYYKNEYLSQLHGNQDPKDRKSLESYWTDEAAVIYLQYQYISNNKNEKGSKHLLDYADDGSKYAKLHKLYHPVVRSYLDEFGFYDIFLVDHETGHIVYSVYKEADYGTSLTTGPYKNTNFAEVVKAAARATDKDFIQLIDFKNYEPSYDAPASFIASPIYDGDKKLGVAVFQMPIDSINAITTGRMNWKKDGFGDSGETYIIGSDGKMKSVARKLIEEDGKYKAGFMQSLKENNINDSIYQKIDKFDTTIGMADVKTEAANKASNGGTGWIIASNYLGENTISSYSPLDIKDVNWSIVSEMQTNEAFMSITQLSQSIIMWGVGILIVALLLSIFLGNSITSPIARSSATLKDISQGDGDLTSRFDQNDNSNDHTDKLARYFNIFIDKIHRIVKDVTGVSSQLETSSTDGGNIAEELSNAALQLKNSSEASSTAITQMDNQLQTAASSGDEISSLMKNVSAAVTQMAATTKEMAGQCSESASQARFANDKSQESGVVMKQLTEAAEKIGAVVDTISDIADKTDLLALNATIEAASAGEAGKGFAVVATEIKELSKQTQGATGEISSLIEGIRDTAQNASNSSLEISKIVTELNNILEGIAAGVEEMAATAQEVDSNVLSASNGADDIASNIKEISKGSGDFKGNILEISKYAESTEANANKSSKVAKQLNELSDLLKSQVSQFKV